MKSTLLALSLLGSCAVSTCTLGSCARRSADDLPQKIMFTAAGSYDASADHRTRLGKGMRQVNWQSHPPLAAQGVSLKYNSDVRPMAWDMTIQEPTFSAQALASGKGKQVSTSTGPALLITSGALDNILILQRPSSLELLTRGYAAQQRPELLRHFRQ